MSSDPGLNPGALHSPRFHREDSTADDADVADEEKKRWKLFEIFPLPRFLFFILPICVICGSNSSIRDFAILLDFNPRRGH
jgi:hypothetical protein